MLQVVTGFVLAYYGNSNIFHIKKGCPEKEQPTLKTAYYAHYYMNKKGFS